MHSSFSGYLCLYPVIHIRCPMRADGIWSNPTTVTNGNRIWNTSICEDIYSVHVFARNSFKRKMIGLYRLHKANGQTVSTNKPHFSLASSFIVLCSQKQKHASCQRHVQWIAQHPFYFFAVSVQTHCDGVLRRCRGIRCVYSSYALTQWTHRRFETGYSMWAKKNNKENDRKKTNTVWTHKDWPKIRKKYRHKCNLNNFEFFSSRCQWFKQSIEWMCPVSAPKVCAFQR